MLTETFLNENIISSELCLSTYNVFRCDRNENTSDKLRGGGVLIAVNKKIPTEEINVIYNTVEQIFVLCKLSNAAVILGCVYLPPDSGLDSYEAHCEEINSICKKYPSHQLIICGDYNLPNLKWDNSFSHLTAKEEILNDTAIVHELSQINCVRNINDRILDLVFVNTNLRFSFSEVIEVLDPILPIDSHHPALSLEISFNGKLTETSHSDRIFNFRKANFDEMNCFLREINWALLSDMELDASIDYFYNAIYNSFELFVPKISVHDNMFPTWFNKELMELTRSKKLAHKKYKISNSNSHYLSFQNLRAQCKALSKICYENYLDNVEMNIDKNVKFFWNHFNKLKFNQGYPLNMHLDDVESSDGQVIADLFAKNFSSVYNSNSNYTYNDEQFPFLNRIDLNSCHLSVTDISFGLKSLNISSGTGPDKVPSICLKNCADTLSYPLFIIFNKSLKVGIFPEMWKTCFAIPVYKSGDKSDIRNYRPVIKQSSIPKLFEKLVLDDSKPSIIGVILSQQHGFMEGRSTLTNLLIYQDFIGDALSRGFQVDSVYTDFCKAFDKMDLNLMSHKLYLYGFRDPLLSWFISFLKGRIIMVKFLSHLSKSYEALSGVPQGSHIGPYFFLLFINDIGLLLYILFLLFADDLKMYHIVKSIQDCVVLQDNLNQIIRWCKDNNMELNAKKCSVISFGKSSTKIVYDYFIEDTKLKREHSVKDLGVIFTSNLDFSDHIRYIKNKALKQLGFIIRNTKGFSNPSTLIKLYNSYVRSHLEYLSTVWNPFYAYQSQHLEIVQNKFLRQLFYFDKRAPIMPSLPYVSISILRIHYNVLTLECRRKQMDLIVLFNLIHNKIKCSELLELINFNVPGRLTRNKDVFFLPFSATNFFSNLPVYRLHKIGNECTLDIFNCNKSDLRSYTFF